MTGNCLTFVVVVLARCLGRLALVRPGSSTRSPRPSKARASMKISLAHVAARIIGGGTVHNYLARYMFNGSSKGVILLDEISNEVLPLLAALDISKLNGTRIITFGDWDQLPPPLSQTMFLDTADCTSSGASQPQRCDPEHFRF